MVTLARLRQRIVNAGGMVRREIEPAARTDEPAGLRETANLLGMNPEFGRFVKAQNALALREGKDDFLDLGTSNYAVFASQS